MKLFTRSFLLMQVGAVEQSVIIADITAGGDLEPLDIIFVAEILGNIADIIANSSEVSLINRIVKICLTISFPDDNYSN